ncbi:MAG: hypothetical protein RR588_02045 [Solibacillus sp.]
MTLTVQISGDGTLIIEGDEKVVGEAAAGNGNIDAELTSIEGVSVNAHNLSTLFNRADSGGPLYDGNNELAGYPKAKQYAALKQKFIEQQALIQLERAKPKVSHAPAITSRSIKPVNG